MRELKITPTALADVQDGMDFYNSRRDGLGDSFEEVIAAYIEVIVSHPEAGIIHKSDVRYRVVQRFPYLIFYQTTESHIAILRVFNTYQNPERMGI